MSFMCQPCCKKAGVEDLFLPISFGRCEDCSVSAACADIPTSILLARQTPPQPKVETGPKKYYVSLSGDLLHTYIEFEAESKLAIEQYLQKQYFYSRGGASVWRLPWCAVYSAEEFKRVGDNKQAVIVRSQSGQLFERGEMK